MLDFLLISSAIGVIAAKKPVHACLFFMATLLFLSASYIQLAAQFIGVMQLLVYAGAILVLFMFVIILFQDAHQAIASFKAKSRPALLISAGLLLVAAFLFIGTLVTPAKEPLLEGFGTVQSLGKLLYLDFFFPFEAVIVIFLVALVGSIYIAKREK